MAGTPIKFPMEFLLNDPQSPNLYPRFLGEINGGPYADSDHYHIAFDFPGIRDHTSYTTISGKLESLFSGDRFDSEVFDPFPDDRGGLFIKDRGQDMCQLF